MRLVVHNISPSDHFNAGQLAHLDQGGGQPDAGGPDGLDTFLVHQEVTYYKEMVRKPGRTACPISPVHFYRENHSKLKIWIRLPEHTLHTV